MEAAQFRPIQQRFSSVEERPEQRRKLGHGLRRLSRADADPQRQAVRDPYALADQTALPHTSFAVDQENRTPTRADPLKLLAQHAELTTAAVPWSITRISKKRPARAVRAARTSSGPGSWRAAFEEVHERLADHRLVNLDRRQVRR
jgi:hypothetical protein